MSGRIVVGTDTSASADLAVAVAVDLARSRDAELVVLHVRTPNGSRDVVDPRKAADPAAYLNGIGPRFPGLRTRMRTEHGDAAERICQVAAEEGADTIVVGNRGAQGRWWRVRDAVPTMVVRHAPCSVLIVDTRAAQ